MSMNVNMSINTNSNALTNYRNLTQANKEKQEASERLSSGSKINSASDDAAGLAISSSLEAQIASLGQAMNNVADTSNMIQVAEGALASISDMSIRVKELSVQAANGTTSAADKALINNEISSLVGEMNSSAQNAQFNGKNVLDGSVSNSNVQIGVNQNTTVDIEEFSIDPTTQEALTQNTTELEFSQSLNEIDGLIDSVSSDRASLGASQNRLEYTSSVIAQSRENLESANSTIKDADMAKEIMNYTSKKIIQNVNMTLMAQSNQSAMNTTRLLMM